MNKYLLRFRSKKQRVKNVTFKSVFIITIILLISGCSTVSNESVILTDISGTTENKATIKSTVSESEYKGSASDTLSITAFSNASEMSDALQPDISKEYLGLDETPLIIPAKEEWNSSCPWDSSSEYDSNAASGIYNDGITYFLNGESYIRFPTGYNYLVYGEETNDTDLTDMERVQTEWKKISVGDEIGTLKVEKAYTAYSYYEQTDKFLWNDIEVQFSGEAVLDGFLVKYSSDDVMYPNCIHFIPNFDSLTECEFPLLSESRIKEGTTQCFKLYFSEGYYVCADTIEISVNSLSNAALEELSKKDNGFIEARVTLSNIELKAWVENVGQNRYCSADLIDIAFITQ